MDWEGGAEEERYLNGFEGKHGMRRRPAYTHSLFITSAHCFPLLLSVYKLISSSAGQALPPC